MDLDIALSPEVSSYQSWIGGIDNGWMDRSGHGHHVLVIKLEMILLGPFIGHSVTRTTKMAQSKTSSNQKLLTRKNFFRS